MSKEDKEAEPMSESAEPWNQPDEETREAAKPIGEELEEALSKINTTAKADALAQRLAQDAEGKGATDEAEKAPDLSEASPELQAGVAASEVEKAVDAQPNEPISEAAAAIETIAREAASLEGPAYEALVEAVQEVTDPGLQGQPDRLEQPRRFLRDAIMQRMSFFQKYDTALFIAINNGLHTPAINRFMQLLSFIFNGGWGWLIGATLFLPFRPRETKALIKRIAPPIWVGALMVEGPVKKYFRRKRPFIDVVRAIVVGKKPGNWSFPSGHASAAFAGAWALDRALPRWKWIWYPIAALVGFSRVYLGAHYPGDVLSGSLLGIALSEGTRRLMRHWGIAWDEE